MQRALADMDWRVAPDGVEHHVGGYVVGQASAHVEDIVGLGVLAGQGYRTLVHVDRPHNRVRRSLGHRDGDGACAATEIEQIAGGRRRRCLQEQEASTGVERAITEHAAIGCELQRALGKGHGDHIRLASRRWLRAEVVLVRHSAVVLAGVSSLSVWPTKYAPLVIQS